MELFLHDEHRDPHLAGKSLILKAGAHIEQGDTESAVRSLEQAAGLIDPERNPRLVLCIHHNLVDNLSKMGRHKEAADLFLDDRNPFEAALATLDLVVSHLEEGHTAEVRVLADEMVAVFRAHDAPREALAAVLLFQEAAHREAATAELAREVAASISQARRGARP